MQSSQVGALKEWFVRTFILVFLITVGLVAVSTIGLMGWLFLEFVSAGLWWPALVIVAMALYVVYDT